MFSSQVCRILAKNQTKYSYPLGAEECFSLEMSNEVEEAVLKLKVGFMCF